MREPACKNSPGTKDIVQWERVFAVEARGPEFDSPVPIEKVCMGMYPPVTIELWRAEAGGSLGLAGCLPRSGSLRDTVSKELGEK